MYDQGIPGFQSFAHGHIVIMGPDGEVKGVRNANRDCVF